MEADKISSDKEFRRKVVEARRKTKVIRNNDGTIKVVKRESFTASPANQKRSSDNSCTSDAFIVKARKADAVPQERCYAQLTADVPTKETDSSQDSMKLPSSLNYRLCLMHEEEGVVILNRKMIAIAEYDDRKASINVTNYRVVVSINGSLYCSCQNSQQVMMGACNAIATWKFAEPCHHVAILNGSKTLPKIDDWLEVEHSYSTTIEDFQTLVYPVNEWTAVVFDPNSRRFGCVYVHAGSIRCQCSSHRSQCWYVVTFRKALDTEESLRVLAANLNDFQIVTVKERTSISWKPIPLAVSNLVRPTKEVLLKLQCPHCPSTQFVDIEDRKIVCFAENSSFFITAFEAICLECKATAQCDGGEFGVLNMGDYAVTHAVLRDYLHLFVSDGLALNSFHKKICWACLESGQAREECISYYLLRMAWVSFSRLLQLDNFSCSVCQLSPPTIICDGLSLAYMKKHRLLDKDTAIASNDELFSGCSYSELLVVKNRQCRTSIQDTLDKLHIQHEDLANLLEVIKFDTPWLVPVIEDFIQRQTVPVYWRRILKDLSKSAAICGFAQCSLEQFKRLVDDLSSDELFDHEVSQMADICPPVYHFVLHATPTDRALLVPILLQVLKVLEYVENHPTHSLPPTTEPKDVNVTGCFPQLPIIRQRGSYAVDKNSTTDSCRKLKRGHKALLPGIFLLHCEHGVCYGFNLMDSSESPDVPFTAIVTRFQQATRLIVYDNACNLHQYALRRNPGFFRGTKFMVDRFHWNNHVACSSGYCIDGYPAYRELNTQVAEQRNSTLNRLKSSLSYQHQENFINSLKVFLCFRNTLNILKLRNPKNDSESILKRLCKI